jgi:hypothetical protein
VARMTFHSPGAMEAQLAQSVTAGGHTMETYEAWRDRLSRRPLRRVKIFRVYRSICGVQNPNDDPNATS